MDETLPYNPNMFLGAPAQGFGSLAGFGAPSISAFGRSNWTPQNTGLDLGMLDSSKWNLGQQPQSFMGRVGNWFSNGQNLGAAANAFGSLASAYLGFQQLKQAKANLNFQRQAFDANLTNSIASYNTSLEDKIRGRTSDYSGKEADVQAYLNKHSLKKGG